MTLLDSASRHGSSFLLADPQTRMLARTVLDSMRRTISIHEFRAGVDFDTATSISLGEARGSEFILLDRRRREVYVLPETADTVVSATDSFRLPFEPRDIVVGDCNNDGWNDLLISDRREPGIHPYYGDTKGRFRPGKVIGPEIAAGPFVMTYLNDDQLVDILVYDWVRSTFCALYGVGRGRFIEQSTFPVQSTVLSLTSRRTARLEPPEFVATCINPSHAEVWKSSDVGELTLVGKIPLEPNSGAAGVASFGPNSAEFAAAIERNALSVMTLSDEGKIAEKLSFYAGEQPIAASILSSVTRGVDILVLDGAGCRLHLFTSPSSPGSPLDSLSLATGGEPEGIVRIPRGNSSQIGVATACRASSALFSYGFDFARHTLERQVLSLPSAATLIQVLGISDSSTTMLLASRKIDSVTTLVIAAKDNSSSNVTIPTDGGAEALFGTGNPRAGFDFGASILGRNGERSLSFYQQISPATFLERNFRLTSPAILAGATVADIDRDSLLEIVYAFKSSDTSLVDFAVAFGDSDFALKQRGASPDVALAGGNDIYLWTADFGGRDTLDLLAALGGSSHALMLLRGRGDGTFADSTTLSNSAILVDRSMLAVVDCDGDGRLDILMNSSANGGITWLRNAGKGAFDPPRVVCADPGTNHFTVADADGDGTMDLFVSSTAEGLIRMINGKYLFQLHDKPGGR